jgi:hypothetical protein
LDVRGQTGDVQSSLEYCEMGRLRPRAAQIPIYPEKRPVATSSQPQHQAASAQSSSLSRTWNSGVSRMES